MLGFIVPTQSFFYMLRWGVGLQVCVPVEMFEPSRLASIRSQSPLPAFLLSAMIF
jgi:hypothetical protein